MPSRRARLVLGLGLLALVWPAVDYARWHRGFSPFNPAPRKGI